MKNHSQKFSLTGLLKSFKNAGRGFLVLLKAEYNLYIQIAFGFFAIILGFLFQISLGEWALQTVVTGLVIFAELVNTAIEKIMDLVHPEYNVRVRDIKDLAAGTVLFMVIIALTTASFIYIPKFHILITGFIN